MCTNAANTATYGVVADGASYPDAEFALTVTYSVAPTEGSIIGLYAQPINIDGTADTEVPEATRPTLFLGGFVVNNVTTAQTMWLYAQDVPLEATYYLHNNNTGQTISSNWVLKVTPRTVAPAP